MPNHTKDSVDVLMATYNGAGYVGQQIDSLLAQDFKSLRLVIRDDGSTDSTREILETYAKENPGVIVLLPPTGNLGVRKNFSRLLEQSSADYIFFSDQDDVWDSDKVRKSLEKMKALEKVHGRKAPLLVHTDLKVVSKNLSLISPSFWKYAALDPFKGKTLNRLLMQNVVTGCTALINRPLLELSHPIPECCAMHDWWVAIVAAAFGTVEPLDQATMAYRQHDNNTLGASRYTAFSYLTRGLKRFRNGGNAAKRAQAREFLRRFETVLSEEQKRMIDAFIALPDAPIMKRAYLILAHGFFKKGFMRNIATLITG